MRLQSAEIREVIRLDDPIGSQIFLQLVLILINAYFAATETAIVSLNENKIRKQAEDGDKSSIRLLRLIETPARFLSTVQVCVTLCGFLASAFAANVFAPLVSAALKGAGLSFLSPASLHAICIVLITLVLSFLMLLLGELVPKRIALQRPERIARMSAKIFRVISVIFTPLVWLLTVSTNGVLRLMRINPNASSEEVTEEEIRMMVDIGSESGAIEQDERAMIENIFEFNNTTAADVMVHRMDVVALHVEDGFDEILKTIRDTGLSRFPVYEDDIDDIIGILNTRNFLLNAQLEHPKPLRELLRTPYLVPETIPADTLFSNMQKQKIHLAVVVDEYGGMSGIVTMEDLLEEIVGNIYDEFDPNEDVEIEKLEENLWRVTGTVSLKTLSETLGVELPLDEEYDTLGGLVFSLFPSIPEDGSTPEVTVNSLHIQVERILDHRVEKALISIVTPEENQAKETEIAEERADGAERSDS